MPWLYFIVNGSTRFIGNRVDRRRLHQRLCIDVLRVFKHLHARPKLDNPAQIHHPDIVADPFNHRHIVRDKQIGQAQTGLQFHHQVQRHERILKDLSACRGARRANRPDPAA